MVVWVTGVWNLLAHYRLIWVWLERVITDMSGGVEFECCFNQLIGTMVTVNHIVLEFVVFFYVFFSSSLKKKNCLEMYKCLCFSAAWLLCISVLLWSVGLHWMNCASLVSFCSSGPVQCAFVSVMAAAVITVSVTAAAVITDPSITGLGELGWPLVGVAILRVTHQNLWSQKEVAVWRKAMDVSGQIAQTYKCANISGVLRGEKGCFELT